MWEQFEEMLKNIEDGDTKTNLLSGFSKIREDNKKIIEARDGAKKAKRDLESSLVDVKKVLGVEDLTQEAVNEVLKGKKDGSTDEVEQLREKYSSLESEYNSFKNSAKEKEFELALNNSKIMESVKPSPFMRKSVVNTIKDKLTVGDDGEIYARGDDGSIQTDILTGKPIKGIDLFENLVKNGEIDKAALISNVKGGTGENGAGGSDTNVKSNFGGTRAERLAAIEKMKGK